jgi:hypothetical protein
MNFFKRFNIQIDIEEAKKRFVNRLSNTLFDNILFNSPYISRDQRDSIIRFIATALGKRYDYHRSLAYYLEEDFINYLHAIEVFYEYGSLSHYSNYLIPSINDAINYCFSQSELDIGIIWHDGKFIKKGAEVLDQALINDPLKWLQDPKLKTVLQPFQKALNHYLESSKRPELLADVVTDAYEALETFVKIFLQNDKDLSANQEKYISSLNVSIEYKPLLREYIKYANIFRHGSKDPKPLLQEHETESFIYLTGIFIRLGMQKYF